VGISAIALAVLGALLLLRRRRKTLQQPEGDSIPEMEDRDEVLSSKKWYLFGKWRNEMPAENQRQELDPKAIHQVNQVPVELDSSERPQEMESNYVGGVQLREGEHG
jgi:hypothetical protein